MLTRRRFRSVFAAGIAAAIASGCGSVLELDDALTAVPYTIERNGRIVIEARVNGQGPYRFILDTGASISVIFEELAEEVALQPIPASDVMVHGVVASGTFPLVGVDRFDVGDVTWDEPRVVLLPDDAGVAISADGLLGVNFLSRYAVGFSASERIVRFYPQEVVAERAYRGWDPIPLRTRPVGQGGAVAYFVDIEIGGRSLPAALDLGSGINMINVAGRDVLKLVPVRTRGQDEVTGILGRSAALARFTARSVRTAGTRWRDEEFLVANFEIFEAFGLLDRPGAILGAGFFTQRDFVLDFARSRLLVRSRMAEVKTTSDSASPDEAP